MKLLRTIDAKRFARGSVLTIGNFDGVHLGHQALLAKLKTEARQRALPLVVILFEPQPTEYFLQDKAVARLTCLREKSLVLKKLGVDYLICLKFNKALAAMPASEFAQHYFFERLQAKYILIGADFRFGKDRAGDGQLLAALAESAAEVAIFKDFLLTEQRISSTLIRQALAEGALHQASLLLGRPFSLCRRVVAGQGLGRQWQIPTANLAVHQAKLALKGVFVVQVLRESRQEMLFGVANLGNRPTIAGSKNVLEVHLFDFNDELYGERLEVIFLHKLRDEIKFASLEALIAQIKEDINQAKIFLNNNKTSI